MRKFRNAPTTKAETMLDRDPRDIGLLPAACLFAGMLIAALVGAALMAVR